MARQRVLIPPFGGSNPPAPANPGSPRQEPTRNIVMMSELKVFSGNGHVRLAKAICDYLRIPLGNWELTRFSDGEAYCPDCGAEISDLVSVCPRCGSFMEGGPERHKPIEKQLQRKWWILVVVAVIAATFVLPLTFAGAAGTDVQIIGDAPGTVQNEPGSPGTLPTRPPWSSPPTTPSVPRRARSG